MDILLSPQGTQSKRLRAHIFLAVTQKQPVQIEDYYYEHNLRIRSHQELADPRRDESSFRSLVLEAVSVSTEMVKWPQSFGR